MARARDKDELLRQARENYDAFNKLVDGMSQKQMENLRRHECCFLEQASVYKPLRLGN